MQPPLIFRKANRVVSDDSRIPLLDDNIALLHQLINIYHYGRVGRSAAAKQLNPRIDEMFTNIELKGNTLKYQFVPRNGESAPPLRHLSAKLDVDTGRVDFDDYAPLERRDPELLAWLQEGMTEHHLARLRKRWRYVKSLNKEEWRRRDWNWWEQGDMVSWLEVYPDDSNLLFELDGTVYWADDMYCINPGCECNEVGLAFSFQG